MKEVTLPIKSEALITNRYTNKSYLNIDKLIVGRENIDEIRSYISINFKSSIKEVNVVKIVLSLYLEEIDLKNESDCFMLSIGTVFNNSNKEEISWNNSPKFYQESLLYKIRDKDKKKYIKFDITPIYTKYILKDKWPVGFVLLCFNANAIVSFSSIKTSKKGIVIIYYNESIFDKEEIKIESNNNYKERAENEIYIDKSYGQFYTEEGKVINNKLGLIVIFNNGINNKGIYLDKDNSKICINKIGVYKIEYSINCRSNEISTMMLKLNNSIIPSSIVEVGSNEGVTTGHCIISTTEENMILQLGICGKDILILDIGIAANITIVEI